MNDLHDLMYRSSDGDPNRSADPMALLRQGRRRVHRRRGIAAVSGTAAASLAIAGAIAWLPGATDGGAPRTDGPLPVAGGQSAKAEAPADLTRAEIERRCTIVNRNMYGRDYPAFHLGFPRNGPWHEGQKVFGSAPFPERGENSILAMSCVIPEEGREGAAGTVTSPVPSANDHVGLKQACGRYGGMDLGDWTVMTADSADDTAAVVFRSGAQVAYCVLDPEGTADGSRFEIAPLDGRRNGGFDYQVWLDGVRIEADGDQFAYATAAHLDGPDQAARIVVTEADGTTHEIPVVNNWYAFAGQITDHKEPDRPGDLHFTVFDASGSVLAEYDEADLPSKAWDES